MESMIAEVVTMREALEQIQRIISEVEWDSDTVSLIAEILADVGYPVEDIG